jgi:hypothetical protein
MRLRSDPVIREALYGLYLALFKAGRSCPDDFKDSRLTTILTAIMGIENIGWRVVGITREALDLLATEDFHKHKLPRRLCRGHIVDRIQTTRVLFGSRKPHSLNDFFEKFFQNDQTVIMLNEQNRNATRFPDYIKIDNRTGTFFQMVHSWAGSIASWSVISCEKFILD